MVYLDDDLPDHPKIFRAGLLLGEGGAAFVLALHVSGIAHARKYLTDGFVPDEFVTTSRLVPNANVVAKVMSSRRVRLWSRVRNGYQIRDWLDWNKSAIQIKKIREKERVRKAKFRRRVPPDVRPESRVSSGRTSGGRPDTHYHNHTHNHTHVQEHKNVQAVASPRRVPRDTPTTATLLRLTHTVLDDHPDESFTDQKDLLKDACARLRLTYTADTVGRALEGALFQRQRKLA